MKIELSDNTKMHTAISLGNRHCYFDALCIFAQIDSYESILNQIVCLAQMEDVAYAADLYRYVKQRFGNTHAVYLDILQFGELTENILMFCESDPKYARAHDGKMRADSSLLMENVPVEFEDYAAPDLDYAADTLLYDDPQLSPNNFYDVKSTRYFDSLRVNLEKCIMDGDEKGAKEYTKRLLQVETNHLPTLETQISLILYTERYKEGLVYARRLSQVDGGSHAAVGGAIDIVMRTNPHKHSDILKKLMYKALDVIEDITLYDLEDYIYIATAYVFDMEMAYKFAKALYRDYKSVSIEGLQMCACAFFNYGDVALAREAALFVVGAVPHSASAQILAEYIRKTPFSKNMTPMDLAPRQLRHFCLPAKLTVYANLELCKFLDAQGDGEFVLNERALCYLSVLIIYCKSLILTNQQKEYYQTVSFLRALLRTCKATDRAAFLQFLKTHLLATMCDQCLSEAIIARLVWENVAEKLYVGLTNGYYLLDFGKIQPLDELFVEAFAICASLVQVTPQKYQDAYLEICATMSLDQEDQAIAHKVAFALLCMCEKNFADMPEAEYFVEGEFDLYRQYRALKKAAKARK